VNTVISHLQQGESAPNPKCIYKRIVLNSSPDRLWPWREISFKKKITFCIPKAIKYML